MVMTTLALAAATAATVQIPEWAWGILGTLAGLAIGVIAFFVKGLAAKPEKQAGELNQIKLEYATKEDVKAQGADINIIKQTYVNKEELREFKKEIRGETAKLTSDVEEIKANYLTKGDYLHYQARTDDKLETMYRILLEMKGGGGNGNRA
ncbi:hypothetical protein LJC64_02365 [Ruminococcaceae bacterium OttesenSCG-928-A11]|nr:hypothetical protein [Ruminococcaceae bacterium OttesenSCG-928-A11]